ncbi:hypothetical protein [Burkholderia sp. Ax-1724]|uniref:hypothetical protein n=1 Tax=Burkholderia sp. Ax-1724 TaxID=2608336 RepID=UPI00141FE1D5|nr:hypothetical protein [Burkholderia sp. Ax-1724]NIF52612.1 hypothetical protein [Burkholderia sp. Ax-1724]
MNQRIQRNKIAVVLALATSALLSACSGSPSEDDVRAALEKQVDVGRQQAEQIAGKNSFVDQQVAEQKKAVADVKLIGCKADGDKAYVCDIQGKVGAARIRMLKGSDGWLAADADKG